MKNNRKILIMLTLIVAMVLMGLCGCEVPSKGEKNGLTINYIDGETMKVTYDSVDEFILKVPDAKVGYEFDKWYLDADFETEAKLEDIKSGDLTLAIDLYANWTANTYTLSFDVSGGEGEVADVTVTYDSVIGDLPVLTKESYDFNSWKIGENAITKETVWNYTENQTAVAGFVDLVTDVSDLTFELNEDETGYLLKGVADSVKDTMTFLRPPKEYEGKPITEIGMRAFSYVTNLKIVDLSQMTELTIINDYAFWANSAIESISLKGLSKLTTIGDSVFKGDYDSRPEENTPDNLEFVDFTGCTSLVKMGQMAFEYQEKIKTIDLSDTALITMGRYAFSYCEALESVALPNSLQDIGSDPFRACEKLTSIEVGAGNISYLVEDGVLYTADKTEIIKHTKSEATTITVPATVTKICSNAFFGAKELTVIDLSACASLAEIKYNAFAGCVNAVVSVPFNNKHYMPNETKVAFDNDVTWMGDAKEVIYGDFKILELNVTGVTNDSTTIDESVTLNVTSVYGEENATVEVKLGETVVAISDDGYVVSLAMGENTITVNASCDGKTKTASYKVTRCEPPKPVLTIEGVESTQTANGTISFTINVKDNAGNTMSGQTLTVQVKHSEAGSYYTPASWAGEWLTITESSTGVFAITINLDTLYDSAWEDLYIFQIYSTDSTGVVSDAQVFEVEYGEAEIATILTLTGVTATQTANGTISCTVNIKDSAGNAMSGQTLTVQVKHSEVGSYYTPASWAGEWLTITESSTGVFAITINLDTLANSAFEDLYIFQIYSTDSTGVVSDAQVFEVEYEW